MIALDCKVIKNALPYRLKECSLLKIQKYVFIRLLLRSLYGILFL